VDERLCHLLGIGHDFGHLPYSRLAKAALNLNGRVLSFLG
jgi:hypothetical protein